MLYISHLLKSSLLMGLAVFTLAGCTTTTTLVEPQEPERLSPEPDVVVPHEPEFVPYPAATEGSVTLRKNKHTSTVQFRPAQQAKPHAEKPTALPVIEKKQPAQALTDAPNDQTKTTVEKDPLTEQYRVDAPKFDPALGEESSESSETEATREASEHATVPESSASSESTPPSDNAQSAASSSESAQKSEPEPETAEPQSASATKKETGSSGSKELSDEKLTKAQIAGGGSPASEPPASVATSPAEQEKDVPTASATGAKPESEPPKPEASAGEEEKPAAAAGGLNVPTDEPAVSDKTDHSKHDHRYIADQHVEGAEEDPPKKTKSLHWNMQRQVKKSAE